MAEIICKKCGAKIQPGMKFCIECGEPVPAEAPAQAAPVEAPKQQAAGYVPPQQPVQPRRPEAVNEAMNQQPEARPAAAAYVAPAAPAGGNYTYSAPVAPVVVQADQRPPKGSPYEPISSWGYVGISLLMSIPVIGLILTIVWACGGCTKINKRNYARSFLLIFLIALVITVILAILAAVLGWTDQLKEIIDQMPGSSYGTYGF